MSSKDGQDVEEKVKPKESPFNGFFGKMFGGGEKPSPPRTPPIPASDDYTNFCTEISQVSKSALAAPNDLHEGIDDGENEKFPQFPNSDSNECLPPWLCIPPDMNIPDNTRQELVIPPIILDESKGFKNVGTSVSELNISTKPSNVEINIPSKPSNVEINVPSNAEIPRNYTLHIQSIEDIPVQLLPVNYKIPPIPRSHDQPDCPVGMRSSANLRYQPKESHNYSKESRCEVSKSQLQTPQKPLETYCSAVDSLCSAVEGLLLRVSRPTLATPNEESGQHKLQQHSTKALIQPLMMALSEIDKSIKKQTPSIVQTDLGLSRKSDQVQLVEKIDKNGGKIPIRKRSAPPVPRKSRTTRARTNPSGRNLNPFSNDDQIPLPPSRAKKLPAQYATKIVDHNYLPEVPKRTFSAHQSKSKHLIEIPTPGNPFLSMTWITSGENSYSGRSCSRPLQSSRSRPTTATGYGTSISKPQPSVATQTAHAFRANEYVFDSDGASVVKGAALNKDVETPYVGVEKKTPPAPAAGKSEASAGLGIGGFFAKLGMGLLFGPQK